MCTESKVSATFLYDTVTAWARVSTVGDDPQWFEWHRAWNEADDSAKRGTVVALALRVAELERETMEEAS